MTHQNKPSLRLEQAAWLNEPRSWRLLDDDGLAVTAEPGTDFWRVTHSGALNHNGHFLGLPVQGDFTARLAVRGEYRAEYDQAGLMLLGDEATWLKTGIELVGQVHRASVVVTRDSSDWSFMEAPNPAEMWFRVTRHGDTIEVSISGDGITYAAVRQCTFRPRPAQVGPYCCSPMDGAGFAVMFSHFELSTPEH
jgi:regulation of enolase protein 1 (concanavalin A-like superfamily)